jgi:hypothetical protein
MGIFFEAEPRPTLVKYGQMQEYSFTDMLYCYNNISKVNEEAGQK